MYVTPRSKPYFLQTRAGRLQALGLILSSGVANALIMDWASDTTRNTAVAVLVVSLALIPTVYALHRLRWVRNNKLLLLIGVYLLFIAYDRSHRHSTADTPYFLGFGILFHLGWFIFLIKNTEKVALIALDQGAFYNRAYNAYSNNQCC